MGRPTRRGNRRLLLRGWPWLLLPAALWLFAAPAYAYADPGTGILIWQLLLAGISGALFYLRRLLRGRRDRAAKKDGTPLSPEE